MLLNLLVRELEDLESVSVGSLRRLCLGEVVHDLLVGEGLLDVAVVEVNDCVSVWEGFSADTVAEDYFLLAIEVGSLDLAVVAYDLVLYFGVFGLLIVIIAWELHFVVFFIIFHVGTGISSIGVHLWGHVVFMLLLLITYFRNVSKGLIASL